LGARESYEGKSAFSPSFRFDFAVGAPGCLEKQF
jgi:hypothetical protein